jgi:hypothetical protein
MTSGNHTIIDIGEMVLCDLCNADYTDSEDEGGILMGTYSICPTCAPGIIRDAERTGEPFVRCPAQTRFKDWVLQLVVYTTAADNSLNPKTRYNVPLTPSSAGALPWYQPSFSTTSGSWRWCASS